MYSCKAFTLKTCRYTKRMKIKSYTTLCKWYHKNGSSKRKFTICFQTCVWKLNTKRLKMQVIKFYGHTSLVRKGSVLRLAYWMREKDTSDSQENVHSRKWSIRFLLLKEKWLVTSLKNRVCATGNGHFQLLGSIQKISKDARWHSTASTMPECNTVNSTSPIAILPTFIRYPRHFSTYLHVMRLRALKTLNSLHVKQIP
jgi:hypothetical protein